jgi:hypothetical protein
MYCTPGGYGYVIPVAAVMVKISKRIQVRVAQRIGETWQTSTRWVEAQKLTPRENHVPAVDDVDLEPRRNIRR